MEYKKGTESLNITRTTSGSERRKESQIRLQRCLEEATQEFAARLKQDYSEEITQDPKTFKKSVLRLVRRELPPKRGRPNDARIDAAVRMLTEQGRSVKDVLRAQVPGFDQMDTYGRYLAEKGLRMAVSRRRNQRQRGTTRSNTVKKAS